MKDEQGLCSVDGGIEVCSGVEVEAVQVDSPRVSAVVTPYHAVRVEHRNELKHVLSA